MNLDGTQHPATTQATEKAKATASAIREFKVHIPKEALVDLRRRIEAT